MQPAMAAPWFRASIAFADSAPKLIPDTLTTDAGRNACRRPRGPPITLADGTTASSCACDAVGAPGPVKVRCLMIGYASAFSTLLSVPKPK